MRTVVVLVALASLTVPALAQSRLPRRSPAEQQVEEINRSLQRRQQQLGSQQQNQIEINQLRQTYDRDRSFPSMTGPGSTRSCPPSSIGC
jgi:hypothetical protein